MPNPLDAFDLPSELKEVLSPVDQAKVFAKIREIHVRLAERDPVLEENQSRGHHLWLVYDAIAQPLTEEPDFKNYLAPEFIPKMIGQIRRNLSWYPHGQEDITYFLKPRILRWQHEVPVREIQPFQSWLSEAGMAPGNNAAAKHPARRSRASVGAGATGRGPGRKAHVESNRSVAHVVNSYGPSWRDNLSEVCEALDGQKVPLCPSKKWKKQGCGDWTDVLAEDREGLVKALQYRLAWVSEHPFDGQNQPRG